jgi:uncharacterized membrane protein YkvA (DUF1232 family)
MAQTTTRGRRRPQEKRLLESTDFTSYLREKAEQLAPADLQTLLAQSEAVRERAEKERDRHPRLLRQVQLALRLLHDHADGQCPQIPYYTICLLAVALLYFADPLDVIPDWIPGIGTADDALVLELAFELGRPGIERYCIWKGISTEGLLLPQRPAPSARPPATKRKRARKPARRR